MSTELLERPTRFSNDDGDHERFKHIIPRGKDGTPAHALVTRAMIDGTPVTALCGKRWVPTRDPDRYPMCPECKRIKAGG